jgi:acyl carrier protein
MNTEQARAAVVDVLGRIAPEADLTQVPGDADFRDELDLDSMDFLSLVEGLEQATGVDVPESHYAQVQTLDGLLGYLVDHAG